MCANYYPSHEELLKTLKFGKSELDKRKRKRRKSKFRYLYK